MEEMIFQAFVEKFKFLIIIFYFIGLIILILHIIGLAKLFIKAGKPGWAAIIPFYNSYVLVEIAGLNWWYFLLANLGIFFAFSRFSYFTTLIFLVSATANFFIFYNLGKKFKQDSISYGFLGAFFTVIMVMVLGFSKSLVYDKNVSVNPNGPIK